MRYNQPMSIENKFSSYQEHYQQREAAHRAEREAQRQAVLAQVLDKWPPLMAAFPALKRAYLYGSLTKPGWFRPDSDIDVALEGLPLEQEKALWDALEASLGDEFMVDLRPLPRDTFFGEQVVQRGILLYERTD